MRFWGVIGLLLAAQLCAAGPLRADIVDPTLWDTLLRQHVRNGRVDYAGLRRQRSALDAYVAEHTHVDPELGTTDEQLAFWINAYNVAALRLVLDLDPLGGDSLLQRLHPANSLRRFPKIWQRSCIEVGGRSWTLDGIAHSVLRQGFRRPRVLFALANGARGAPALRSEAYRARGLDLQLEAATRAYLEDREHGLRIDAQAGTVQISRLFGWYGGDFVAEHAEGPLSGRRDLARSEIAALHFIASRRPPDEAAFLARGEFRLGYLPFDWRLAEE